MKYSLSYAKPADISVVGSYSQKTFVKTEGTVSIDLAVTMPSVCDTFLPKAIRDLISLYSKSSRQKII